MIKVDETPEAFRKRHGYRPPPRVVIADWMRECRAGQWTPFEAAGEVIRVLSENGYQIALEKK